MALMKMTGLKAALMAGLLLGCGGASAVVSSGGAQKDAREGRLRERLTPMQWRVTQENGTEPAYRNAYWDEKRAGLYVDVVSGEPLFSSKHKFDSGTGWPSFSRPIDKSALVERDERSVSMGHRVEVRSSRADSHLGHVFEDGPGPTGLRYCINSAALRFIPVEQLEAEGYGQYLAHFEGVRETAREASSGR